MCFSALIYYFLEQISFTQLKFQTQKNKSGKLQNFKINDMTKSD